MWAIGVRAAAVLMGMASMHIVGPHWGPIRALGSGKNQVILPMRGSLVSAGTGLIEREALRAAGGGRIESVKPSLWVGKPVWMCTVAQGRTVWHVMINQTTLRPISKIIVPR